MPTILLAIDTDTSIDELPGIEPTGDNPHESEDVGLDDPVGILDAVDPAAVDVTVGESHPDWEQGEPCPECGSRGLSILETEESIYDSQDGDFQYVSGGDATGGILSVLCPNCMTYLEHVPVGGLYL
jgi:hypothetical protein